MYQQPAMPTINSVGDGFAWPFRDPAWVSKILLQGVINLIPIVGWMATLGWMLGSLDNLRQGRQELEAAGFKHLGRGAILFAVYFLYALVIGVVASALQAIGGAASGGDTSNAVFVILTLLRVLWQLVAGILLALAIPTIVLLTDRSGFGGGLNVASVVSTITANPGKTLLAGLISIVLNIIGSAGFIVCCVGALFTYTYAAAALAGVVFWLERNLPMGPAPMTQGPGQPPSMPSPPPPPQQPPGM
jgi:Protein of unknown function (DUF4013)